MIVSVLTRNTRISDREAWEAALTKVDARIREVLGGETGFVSVEYFWSIDKSGSFAQVTKWESDEACRAYIRNGGAATVATIEESALPTAPYPNGAWIRANYATTEK